MTNPTQANVRIKAKGMYEDERELLGMLKASYKDYWETKNDGKPRDSESEGNYWSVSHRVHRMEDGSPLIEKEIYYKKPNGEKVRISDQPRSPEGSLNHGLEREREVIENRKVTENMAKMSKNSPNKDGYPKQPRPKDNYYFFKNIIFLNIF